VELSAAAPAETDTTASKRVFDPDQPVPADEVPAVSAEGAPGGRDAANSRPVDSDLGQRGVVTSRAAVASCVPEYPRLSRIRGEEGTVVLEVEVRPDGSPGAIRVIRSSGYPRLDRAAVEGMKRATFSPALRGGRPTGQTIRVAITFELRDEDRLP